MHIMLCIFYILKSNFCNILDWEMHFAELPNLNCVVLSQKRMQYIDIYSFEIVHNKKKYSKLPAIVLNMICGLNVTSSHQTKITKWTHIIIIPLVGPPKPRTKSKNSPTHPGTEKGSPKWWFWATLGEDLGY